MSRCSWCCRFGWLTGHFGRNVCAGLWSGWLGCVIRWNTWRVCKQINRQSILSEHQLYVDWLTETSEHHSSETNTTHTTSHIHTHWFDPHTTNHNTESPLTDPYLTASICMEHSSLISYLRIQARRATTPTQTVSVRSSVCCRHTRSKHMWISGALFNLQSLQCVMSVDASVVNHTVSTHSITQSLNHSTTLSHWRTFTQ